MANRKVKVDNRPKRVPVSGNRDVLTVDGKEEGFVYRWVNDVDNRIDKFITAGYEFVEDEVSIGDVTIDNFDTTNKSGAVSKGVGKGVVSFLMRIDKSFYEEDQDSKQTQINEREADMKRQLNSGADGQYGDVSIT